MTISRQRYRRWRLIQKLGQERLGCTDWRRVAVELAIAAIYEEETIFEKDFSSAAQFRTKRLESDLRPAMAVTAHRAGENTRSGRRESS